MLESSFPQPLSRFSLVYLLVCNPVFHTPYISSPSHYLPFAMHVHIFALQPVLLQYQCYVIIPNLSLSALYLEICLIMSLVDISSDIKLIWKLLVTDLSVDIFMETDFQFLIPKSKSSRIVSVPSHLIASPSQFILLPFLSYIISLIVRSVTLTLFQSIT